MTAFSTPISILLSHIVEEIEIEIDALHATLQTHLFTRFWVYADFDANPLLSSPRRWRVQHVLHFTPLMECTYADCLTGRGSSCVELCQLSSSRLPLPHQGT